MDRPSQFEALPPNHMKKLIFMGVLNPLTAYNRFPSSNRGELVRNYTA
jgi:hypothetical protein